MVYSRGKSCATKQLVLIYFARKYGGVRAGFSVSKKVGGSVVRNKVRRRMKEAFRTYLEEIESSIHIIWIARAPIADADYWSIRKDMRYLLRRAGLLQGNRQVKSE